MTLHDEMNAALWVQRDERLGLDRRCARRQAERESLADCRDDKLEFGEREVLAETNARSAAKGHVAVFGAAGDSLAAEALGNERVGVLPEAPVPMKKIAVQIDIGIG